MVPLDTPAADDSIRAASCSVDISSEKKATPAPPGRSSCRALAALYIRLRASAVLPILGRAAKITRSDFWKPPRRLSTSLRPAVTPVRKLSCFLASSICSITLTSGDLRLWKPLSLLPVSASLNRRLSVWPTISIGEVSASLSKASFTISVPMLISSRDRKWL